MWYKSNYHKNGMNLLEFFLYLSNSGYLDKDLSFLIIFGIQIAKTKIDNAIIGAQSKANKLKPKYINSSPK